MNESELRISLVRVRRSHKIWDYSSLVFKADTKCDFGPYPSRGTASGDSGTSEARNAWQIHKLAIVQGDRYRIQKT